MDNDNSGYKSLSEAHQNMVDRRIVYYHQRNGLKIFPSDVPKLQNYLSQPDILNKLINSEKAHPPTGNELNLNEFLEMYSVEAGKKGFER